MNGILLVLDDLMTTHPAYPTWSGLGRRLKASFNAGRGRCGGTVWSPGEWDCDRGSCAVGGFGTTSPPGLALIATASH